MLRQVYDETVRWWRELDDAGRCAALDSFAVKFAYNSGRIENDEITYHDTYEVFSNDAVSSYTGSLRTLFEIRNLKTAWNWVLDRACGEPFSFDVPCLLEVHQLLTSGTYDQRRWDAGERPGSFKLGDYVVGARAVGEDADDVPALVEGLLAEVSEAVGPGSSGSALTVAAYLHAELARIHPFADGNGRVARLMMNLALMRLGHPPVVVFEEDRLAYYGALDAFDEAEDLDALKSFLMAQTVKAWQPGDGPRVRTRSLGDYLK